MESESDKEAKWNTIFNGRGASLEMKYSTQSQRGLNGRYPMLLSIYTIALLFGLAVRAAA